MKCRVGLQIGWRETGNRRAGWAVALGGHALVFIWESGGVSLARVIVLITPPTHTLPPSTLTHTRAPTQAPSLPPSRAPGSSK